MNFQHKNYTTFCLEKHRLDGKKKPIYTKTHKTNKDFSSINCTFFTLSQRFVLRAIKSSNIAWNEWVDQLFLWNFLFLFKIDHVISNVSNNTTNNVKHFRNFAQLMNIQTENESTRLTWDIFFKILVANKFTLSRNVTEDIPIKYSSNTYKCSN